jgi:hypothetical protein
MTEQRATDDSIRPEDATGREGGGESGGGSFKDGGQSRKEYHGGGDDKDGDGNQNAVADHD